MDARDISKFYRSFSGTDSLVFMLMPYTKPILLGTLTTISYSMFRDKKPVPLIGRINIGGFTRGTRVVAGTMIFTMINQHWVNELLQQVPWLQKYGKIKADELPIFDLMIVCANEYGASVQMFIYGVDITDEGQVLSIEDMFTENQFSFIARDVNAFADDAVPGTPLQKKHSVNRISSFDLQYNSDLNPQAFLSTRVGPSKSLRLDSGNMVTGDDVIEIQTQLNNRGVNVPISGIYDTTTFEAVKEFQSQNGLPITGGVDDKTYLALKDDAITGNPTGVVVAKSGVTIYESPSTSSKITANAFYKDSLNVLSQVNNWIQVESGYIPSHQVFVTGNEKSFESYPELRLYDKGSQVTILQEALNSVLATDLTVSGVMDRETVEAVKEYQRNNNLADDGVVNTALWVSLKETSNINPGTLYSNYKFDIEFLQPPRRYSVSAKDLDPALYGLMATNFTKDSTIRLSAVTYYPNGKVETFVKTKTVLANTLTAEITANDLQEAFLYNPKHQSMPSYVEFIIYPLGSLPLKWSINIEG